MNRTKPKNGRGILLVAETSNEEELVELLSIFEQISKTNSANEKVLIINKHKEQSLLLPALKYLCDERVVSGLSKKKIQKQVTIFDDLTELSFDEVLRYLMSNSTGTDKTIGLVRGYVNAMNLNDSQTEMIENIITKRSKYGLSESSVNKVYGKNTVVEWKIMKGSPYEKHENKIKGCFSLSKKLDGNRMFIIIQESDNLDEYLITYKAKTGATLDGMSYLDEDIFKLARTNKLINLYGDVVLDGEMLAKDDGNMTTNELYRKTQTLIKAKGDKYGMDYNVYDIVPYDEFIKGKSKDVYSVRREKMNELFTRVDDTGYELDNIKLLPVLYHGDDKSEIDKWSDWATKNDYEGVMLNLDSGFYETKRVSSLLKIKQFHFSDVLVLDVYEGDKKNVGKMGGVVIQFQDFQTKIGSGWTDEQRKKYWDNPDLIKDSIIEIRYFEVTENKQGGKGLRFPTFSKLRLEKTIEDISYE